MIDAECSCVGAECKNPGQMGSKHYVHDVCCFPECFQPQWTICLCRKHAIPMQRHLAQKSTADKCCGQKVLPYCRSFLNKLAGQFRTGILLQCLTQDLPPIPRAGPSPTSVAELPIKDDRAMEACVALLSIGSRKI